MHQLFCRKEQQDKDISAKCRVTEDMYCLLYHMHMQIHVCPQIYLHPTHLFHASRLKVVCLTL